MLVRYAQEGELEAVGRMTVAAYGDQVSERLAEKIGDAAARAREAQLLVCIDEAGTLVGTATFIDGPGRWSEIAQPDEAEFALLAVRRFARRSGAGTDLVERMLVSTAALGKRRLVCSSAADMFAAHEFLGHCGFVRMPERDRSPSEGVTLLAFGCDVSSRTVQQSGAPGARSVGPPTAYALRG
jgi:GNAT superfamily N-acetyltransferase